MTTTLADIRGKVRNLTARPSVNDLSDQIIDNYINTYYQYDMPESMRFLELRDVFTFTTIGNVEVYPFPRNNYLTIEPPAYCAGQQMDFFNNDRDLFYRTWPKDNYIQQVAQGNGTEGLYTGQITGIPFLPSTTPNPPIQFGADADFNVMFSANTTTDVSFLGTATTLYDDGEGGLVDATTFERSSGSAVNYLTGQFGIVFTDPVPMGQPIFASVIPYAPGQPRSVLIAQEQIYLRPIPDKAYLIDITVERKPTALLNDSDSPFNYEWWQLLAFGAAAKILEDNADWDQRNAIQPFFEKQLILMQRRSLNQLTTSRSSTIYSENGQYPYSNLYPYI
jgi:hypothetical protein